MLVQTQKTFVHSRECHVCHKILATKKGRDMHEQRTHGIDHGFEENGRRRTR